MRSWYVNEETPGDFPVNTVYYVFRNDGKLYATCPDQVMAANVCSALNWYEQSTIED